MRLCYSISGSSGLFADLFIDLNLLLLCHDFRFEALACNFRILSVVFMLAKSA